MATRDPINSKNTPGGTVASADLQSKATAAGFGNGTSTSGGTTTVTTPVTVPAAVPTKAPAVMSATAATNKVNNVIVPTMNTANAAVANQNISTAATKDPNYNFQPGESATAYNARIKAYQASLSPVSTAAAAPAPATPSATDQAAADIANTPDAGHQFAWDANGNKIPIPVGTTPPSGYSTTAPPPNPVTSKTPMTSSFQDAQGNTFAKYNDGTYGQIDSNGNFVGNISVKDFNNAQKNSPQAQLDNLHAQIASVQTSLALIAKGAYPLNPTQQAVINGLQIQLQADVATQTQANADFTGATSIAMNLYGLGTSLVGIGKIKASVDSGVQKILDLQTKAATATAQMSEAFMKDDTELLNQAYTMYDNSAKEIQSNIQYLQTSMQTAKKDAQDEVHQEFQDTMTSNNYTLSQKKEIFDEYMSQAQLDEQKKNDARTAYYQAQDLALKKQDKADSDPTGSLATLNAARGADGYTDPNKYAELRAASKMSATDFDNRFGYLVNPESTARLGIATASTAQPTLTADQLKQGINKELATPAFKALTPDMQKAYIQSQGGDPADYDY